MRFKALRHSAWVIIFFLLTFTVAPAQDKADIGKVISDAKAALDAVAAKGDLKAIPAIEADWAKKVEGQLKSGVNAKGGIEAWIFLARLYGSAPDCGEKIIDLFNRALVKEGSNPRLSQFIRSAFYQLIGKDRTSLINLLTHGEKSISNPEAKAAALFFHGETLMRSGDMAGAKPLFSRIATDFPDSSFKKSAERNLHEIENLALGKVSPDLKIAQLNGGEIHLSKHKGKVVILFFWTHFAPFLVEKAKQLQDLQTRHKADPFVIIGICLDETRDIEASKKVIKSCGMTWANGHDMLGWNSPLVNLYNIKSAPRAFLINSNGAIHAKDILYRDCNLGLIVNSAVSKRKAEIQRAAEAKKKKEQEAAKAKAAAKKPPAK